jgi:hypothetical protein
MDRQQWKDFKERYPQLSERLIKIGSALYEMGVEKAKSAPELDELVEFLKGAPPEMLSDIGLRTPIDRNTVLAAVIEHGSEMLLAYLHKEC